MGETSLTIIVYCKEKKNLILKNKILEKFTPAEPTGHCRPTSLVTSAYLRNNYEKISTEFLIQKINMMNLS